MPKLWRETLTAHRDEVREAILAAAEDLAQRLGPLTVSMSAIAQRSGIGRATLYKYFPNVEEVLAAVVERHIVGHVTELSDLAAERPPIDALARVLGAYARICRRRQGRGADRISAAVHRTDTVAQAHQQVTALFGTVLTAAVAEGEVRDDVSVDVLAAFCLHACEAAYDVSEGNCDPLVELMLKAVRADPG